MKPFQITEADYLEANRLFRGRRQQLSALMGVVLAVLIVLSLFAFSKNMDIEMGILMGVLIIGFNLLIVYAKSLLFKKTVSSFFKEQKSLHVPVAYTFNEQELSASSDRGFSRIPWTDFLKFKQNDRMFILVETRMTIRIILKSAFESQDEMDRFAALLARIGERSR